MIATSRIEYHNNYDPARDTLKLRIQDREPAGRFGVKGGRN
jgi:hypothetical protein